MTETSTETTPDTPTNDPSILDETPKPKRRGRPRKTPLPAETINGDVAPDPASHPDKTKRQAASATRWKKGVIAAGMTQLYRRTGRIIKAMDRDIGIAVIESAEDCGQAWDELARVNPRIRAFLTKMISGGSVAALVWAHMPILMAVLMKDGIQKHIPFGKLLEASLDDEDGSPAGDMFGGLTAEDMQQAMAMANGMMAGMGMRVDGMGRPSADAGETDDTDGEE